MRILLDENLPKKLKAELPDHDVSTVQQMGWSGKENGELLDLMVAEFDVFITADQNLTYQQNLTEANIAIVVLAAHSTRLPDLIPLMPQVREVLTTIKSGAVVKVKKTDQ